MSAALSFAVWALLGVVIAFIWWWFCREYAELAGEWRCVATERHNIAEAYRDLGRRLTWLYQSVDAIERAERFIAGFEDDETQQGVRQLLADLRAVLEPNPDGVTS